MAEIKALPTWQVTLTNPETSLIVRCLVASKDPEAQRLANTLTTHRAEQLEQQARIFRDMLPKDQA